MAASPIIPGPDACGSRWTRSIRGSCDPPASSWSGASPTLQAEPWAFIRACIWTDGSSFINRTGPYEYLNNDFTNYSRDIVDLLTEACELVGITDYRLTSYKRACKVRINRRGTVALLLEHVDIKQ